VLAPRLGGLAAALLEAVVMAFCIVSAARFASRHQGAGHSRLRMAAVGLAVVLACETLLGVAFSSTGLAAARAPRGIAEQVPGALLLVWMAVAPFCLDHGMAKQL